MNIQDIKTIEDLDRLLDVQKVTVFGGRRYHEVSKQGPFGYSLYNSGTGQETDYVDLSMLLVQLVVLLAKECE